MNAKTIYFMQVVSLLLIWLFVGTITYWILHLLYVAWQLRDAPDASVGISLVAIPVYITLASVLTYVFAGLRRNRQEEEE